MTVNALTPYNNQILIIHKRKWRICPYKGNKSFSKAINIVIALLFDPLKNLIVKKLKLGSSNQGED